MAPVPKRDALDFVCPSFVYTYKKKINNQNKLTSAETFTAFSAENRVILSMYVEFFLI